MSQVLYMNSIRALPEEYIHKETRITEWTDRTVVVTNSNLPPMVFREENGWKKINNAPSEVSINGRL